MTSHLILPACRGSLLHCKQSTEPLFASCWSGRSQWGGTWWRRRGFVLGRPFPVPQGVHLLQVHEVHHPPIHLPPATSVRKKEEGIRSKTLTCHCIVLYCIAVVNWSINSQRFCDIFNFVSRERVCEMEMTFVTETSGNISNPLPTSGERSP